MTPSEQVLQYFAHSHLPEPLQEVVRPIARLALDMEKLLPGGPEKTYGLRQLLLAKDALVRARLEPNAPPWWQTTDLTEIHKETHNEIHKSTHTPHGPPGTRSEEAHTLSDQLNDAMDSREHEEAERTQAKAKSVIAGQCYGPIIAREVDGNDLEHELSCYWNLCTWRKVVHGYFEIKAMQQLHDDAPSTLIP